MDGGAWWAAVHGVAKSRTRLSDFTFTFHFHALQKEMATHSSVLAWRIPGTAHPGGLPSMRSHRVGHDWSDLAAAAAENHETNSTDDINQQNPIIYGTSHPPKAEYILFKYPQNTFLNGPHYGHKTNLKTKNVKEIRSYRGCFLTTVNLKLEIVNTKGRKSPNVWKLSNTLWNNPWVKEELSR